MQVESIVKALGGRQAGKGWIACCPSHEDRNPSLSIKEGAGGKPLIYCHTGCSQAEVINALKSRGLWKPTSEINIFRRFDHKVTNYSSSCHNERSESALRLWNASQPAIGTPLEPYLYTRGITIPVPLSIRFHPHLLHASGTYFPGMVALIRKGIDGKEVAIHRTFLDLTGSSKAQVKPNRMMLGPCKGGAVRLAPVDNMLMVGEGIETCLAAMQATGRPAWAALSTSGLRTLDLPDTICDVIVLADGDDPGEVAARASAFRWKREGRRVRIAHPPQGMDFNDLLLGCLPRIEEDSK